MQITPCTGSQTLLFLGFISFKYGTEHWSSDPLRSNNKFNNNCIFSVAFSQIPDKVIRAAERRGLTKG
ncbi:unnamed protein product [Camellia sinensis]